MRTTWTLLIGLAASLPWAAGCGSSSTDQNLPTANISSSDEEAAVDNSSSQNTASTELTARSATPKPYTNPHPQVEIKTNMGLIRLKLNAEKAPLTVENFLVNYVDRGFYEGTVFHYVESGFIVIAGGYTADMTFKPTRAPIRNEAKDAPQNLRGTVAMSRDPNYADSATSQFFFNLVDNPDLDYVESEEGGSEGYCVFGEVIEGMDVVDRIASSNVHDVDGFPNVPVTAVVIESISRID